MLLLNEGALNNDDGESIRCLMFPEDDVIVGHYLNKYGTYHVFCSAPSKFG